MSNKYFYITVWLVDNGKMLTFEIPAWWSYPDMLQVQGNVPDKRLDESLLQPEPFLSLIKCFIFNLGKNKNRQTQRFEATSCHSQHWQISLNLNVNFPLCWAVMYCTWGEIPVRCLRWLLTRFDFLIMECMLSLEILSMNVSSSPFLYFTTVDSRGKTWDREKQGEQHY